MLEMDAELLGEPKAFEIELQHRQTGVHAFDFVAISDRLASQPPPSSARGEAPRDGPAVVGGAEGDGAGGGQDDGMRTPVRKGQPCAAPAAAVSAPSDGDEDAPVASRSASRRWSVTESASQGQPLMQPLTRWSSYTVQTEGLLEEAVGQSSASRWSKVQADSPTPPAPSAAAAARHACDSGALIVAQLNQGLSLFEPCEARARSHTTSGLLHARSLPLSHDLWAPPCPLPATIPRPLGSSMPAPCHCPSPLANHPEVA